MEGTVTRLVETKGFGFITGEDKQDYFFHRSDFSGFWEDLETDLHNKRVIKVTFNPGKTEKGPRASNVVRIDGGV
jgi:cold shock CspA family protein